MSWLNAARLLMQVDVEDARIVVWLLRAWQAAPHRAEALYEVSTHLRSRLRLPQAALPFAKLACAVQPLRSNQALFLEPEMYTWKPRDALSLALYYTGHFRESALVCIELLASDTLPASESDRVQRNLQFAIQRMRAQSVQRQSQLQAANKTTTTTTTTTTTPISTTANDAEKS